MPSTRAGPAARPKAQRRRPPSRRRATSGATTAKSGPRRLDLNTRPPPTTDSVMNTEQLGRGEWLRTSARRALAQRLVASANQPAARTLSKPPARTPTTTWRSTTLERLGNSKAVRRQSRDETPAVSCQLTARISCVAGEPRPSCPTACQ